MRIGHGYDAHQFAEGRELILGGVEIPYKKGIKSHSDGDVLIHALCDALLGAAALGDIGKFFPSSEEKYKNINSRELLQQVVQNIQQQKFSVQNMDATIVAQQPKLAAYVDAMRANLAADLQIPISQVSVKATTTDGLGFVGREAGIAAHVVVLLG